MEYRCCVCDVPELCNHDVIPGRAHYHMCDGCILARQHAGLPIFDRANLRGRNLEDLPTD